MHSTCGNRKAQAYRTAMPSLDETHLRFEEFTRKILSDVSSIPPPDFADKFFKKRNV
ncbi:MAG: hypothetical protein UU98_C0004G0007 [Parcubacteria group bacterium GW2011_GWD2_42_14]|nr:MAG: hypothetical protein UU98_C0004G0007 [Parcubacteria group bacterium GW2011_GWD2_42_14]